VRDSSGITWHDNTTLDYHREKKVIFNLGIPHGISGIICFLSEMIELGIEVGKCKELLFGSLTWMLNQKSNFDGISFYPSLIVDKESIKITRLSWAYGDLCSAYAFIQGAKHLGSGPWEAEARQTVEITKNRDIQNSLIHVNPIDGQINPGICTGSSGIILMYKKINEFFNDQSITDLMNFWVSKNFNHNLTDSERIELKVFTIDENKNVLWKTDTGFLEGLSGVGLTHLSLLDEDLGSWKRLLLL
jgi:lantibiotic modifying enzyme